jgi:hypothetical protein
MNQVSISAYPGNLHQSQAGNWRPVVLAALVHVLLLGFCGSV